MALNSASLLNALASAWQSSNCAPRVVDVGVWRCIWSAAPDQCGRPASMKTRRPPLKACSAAEPVSPGGAQDEHLSVLGQHIEIACAQELQVLGVSVPRTGRVRPSATSSSSVTGTTGRWESLRAIGLGQLAQVLRECRWRTGPMLPWPGRRSPRAASICSRLQRWQLAGNRQATVGRQAIERP